MTITAEQLAALAAAIQGRVTIMEITGNADCTAANLHRANLEHVERHRNALTEDPMYPYAATMLGLHTRRLMAVYMEETDAT